MVQGKKTARKTPRKQRVEGELTKAKRLARQRVKEHDKQIAALLAKRNANARDIGANRKKLVKSASAAKRR